ncbi:endonuclease domain-containing 1 protein [Bombina bombina]|uniref:endonuclease domain-containing 1 protein n=1 Tax=Bombina bombina TaxID=8345 RepID=UPI00235B0F6C|nr:endonuclease domain-containing 1 protein [Bombina bombina]
MVLRMELTVLLCLAALPCMLARLVTEGEDGFAECNNYFYQGSPPQGFSDPSHAKICQKLNGGTQFATLYSTEHKIPVYSAFLYTEDAASGEGSWLVEPQLDDTGSSLEEVTNGADLSEQIGSLGSNQALEEDYASSDYQPGSLFHKAPNTLTNSVPFSPDFKEKWASNIEQIINEALLPYCGDGGNLHLIAGAIPSSIKINDKVTVPDSVWLAACCNKPEAWSLGIIKNTANADGLEDVTVEELENNLLGGVKLFSNQCGGGATHPERIKISESLGQSEAEPPVKATGPFLRLLQFFFCVIYEIVKSLLSLVWFLVKQIFSFIFGRLYWIWTAVTTYIIALSKVLLNIPCDVLRVFGNIICGFVRILNNMFSVVCFILRLPARFLLDMASFPYYTLCAIPTVGIDILSGVCGIFALGFQGVFGAFGSSFSVASFAGGRFIQRFVGQSEGYDE